MNAQMLAKLVDALTPDQTKRLGGGNPLAGTLPTATLKPLPGFAPKGHPKRAGITKNKGVGQSKARRKLVRESRRISRR